MVRAPGIRFYLLALLAALAAAPLLWLGLSEARRISRLELEQADEAAMLRARALARETEELVASRVRSVELLAAHVEAGGRLEHDELAPLVSAHRRSDGFFDYMYVAGKDGVSIATSPRRDEAGRPNHGVDYSDRDYYRELVETGRTAISRVQLGRRSERPNIQIAAPIRDLDGRLVGFAEGSVDLAVIEAAASRVAADTPGLRAVVTDEHGRAIADSSRLHPPLTDLSSLPLFAAAATGGEIRGEADEAGEPMRGAAAGLREDIGWAVLVIRRRADLEAAAGLARHLTLQVTAATLVVALAFVALLAQLLATPIRRLAASAVAVGAGDLSQPPPPPGPWQPREIAELVTSMRAMIERLGDQRGQMHELIAELESANERLVPLATAIEQAGDGIEIAGADGRLEYVNPAWQAMTGYLGAEAIGRRPAELLGIGDEEDPVRSSSTPWSGEVTARRKDGGSLLLDVTISAVRGGRDPMYVVVRRDITERTKAREALRLSDRMASVGTLAAGVAHEINNPLTYIIANVAFLGETAAELRDRLGAERAAAIEEAVAETLTGLDRVTSIVKGLKSFSRGDEETVVAVDLHQLIESCIRVAQTEIRHRARLECDYRPIPPVYANEPRLAQVFLNLIINAAHAIEIGAPERNAIRIVTSTDEDGNAVVEIADTGSGIAPDELPRIFDPFFTTKPVGVGTGLGLPICHGIVSAFEGRIEVESELGVGSEFRVRLPAGDRCPSPELAPAPAGPETRRRVLVIDDEPTVRRALARLLSRHQVTEAGSAEAALDAVAADRFDLILCDVMMPGISGPELYHRIQELAPEASSRLVFISGGVFSADLRAALDELPAACLSKPVSRSELEAVLADVGG